MSQAVSTAINSTVVWTRIEQNQLPYPRTSGLRHSILNIPCLSNIPQAVASPHFSIQGAFVNQALKQHP